METIGLSLGGINAAAYIGFAVLSAIMILGAAGYGIKRLVASATKIADKKCPIR